MCEKIGAFVKRGCWTSRMEKPTLQPTPTSVSTIVISRVSWPHIFANSVTFCQEQCDIFPGYDVFHCIPEIQEFKV